MFIIAYLSLTIYIVTSKIRKIYPVKIKKYTYDLYPLLIVDYKIIL